MAAQAAVRKRRFATAFKDLSKRIVPRTTKKPHEKPWGFAATPLLAKSAAF
jgi:hypothetical protein